MEINKNIYYRFEPQINGGTLYIYNYSNQSIIKSNYFAYAILKKIDENESYSEIVQHLKDTFKSYTEEELINFYKQVIKYFQNNSIAAIN